MQEAESTLTSISTKCNSGIVDRKLLEVQSSHTGTANKRTCLATGDVCCGTNTRADYERQSISSQLILLEKSITIVSRLLKTRRSVLLAAKLLTISRLLHKTLSQSEEYADLLGSFRKHIGSLRRILLRRVDRHLASLKISSQELVEAICAFCLATSSSSIDAVKHFQHVRLEGMRKLLEHSAVKHEYVSQAVESYVQTLRTTRALLGRRLVDAFRNLRNQPLIQDIDLVELDDLALDVYGRWIPLEVQNFVPWIKVSETSRSEAITFCKAWSKNAFEKLTSGLDTRLQRINSIEEIIQIRRVVLSTWLQSWNSTPSHGSGVILSGLRKTFNDRIVAISKDQSAELSHIAGRLQQILSRDELHLSHLSLWDDDFASPSSSLSDGAAAFKSELINRHLGLSDDALDLKKVFDAWLSNIQNTKTSIEQIGDVKWSDVIEDDEGGDSDLEDDDGDELDNEPILSVRSIERLLQRSDVEVLTEAQKISIEKAVSSIQDELLTVSRPLLSSQGKLAESDAVKCCLLLRLLRIISQRLLSVTPTSDLHKFNSIVPDLHKSIATFIIDRLSNYNTKASEEQDVYAPPVGTCFWHIIKPARRRIHQWNIPQPNYSFNTSHHSVPSYIQLPP